MSANMPIASQAFDDEVGSVKPKSEDNSEVENIDHDDLCPICNLLLYNPVVTCCSHKFCESCLAQWADVSEIMQMTAVDLDERPSIEPVSSTDIQMRCPMCRTRTSAAPDPSTQTTLRQRYPQLYQARAQEEEERPTSLESGASTELVTIYIGNSHRLHRPEDPESHNVHNWTFFVRPSRVDIIEEIQVFLHPTFRNPRVIIQWPPYEITRLGWGFFTIVVHIILKAGYSWDSAEAEDAPDGGEKGMLPLEWMLNFSGGGAQGRCRVKVRRQKENMDRETQIQGERVRRMWASQRESDPDWDESS